MIFGIYDPPRYGSDAQSWSMLKIGDICDALEFDYTKYFCGAGTFTLVIPRNSLFADKISVGSFLIKPSDGNESYDGFIVKNIVYENDSLKITGYDLNGLLLDRITLYPQESTDKAIKAGSTEEIVKYYVDFNCVSSVDTERNFPRLGIAENLDRGAANDAASPRLECVADVIADILGAQGMGYRIKPLLNVIGESAPLMEFEVYEAVDRTQDQNENNRVAFSFGLGNVAQMKREVGVTADKNTFYCELSSGTVQRYYKKGEIEEPEEASDSEEEPVDINIKSGYERREEYLKLDCELNEIEIYAEHEIADRYRLTDSLEITAGNPLDYGTVYNVGDVVTAYDRERNIQLDSIISAVETKHTGTEYSVKITLGDSKPKVLDSYVKKGQATANTVRSSSGSGGGNIPVTSYEYLSDNSVKMNGITYTVEKNGNGLISKITDDIGGELKPEIRGTISDVALQNAVFWAAVMVRGLEHKNDIMPAMNGITGYFIPENANKPDRHILWKNCLKGEGIDIDRHYPQYDNKIEDGTIILPYDNYGSYTSEEEIMTVYTVFKTIELFPNYYNAVITKDMVGEISQYHAFDLVVSPSKLIALSCLSSMVTSSVDSSSWHVVCITRNTTIAKLYIDGELIGSTRNELGEYGGKFWVNVNIQNGNYANVGSNAGYKMIAFGTKEHTHEQVVQNSEWLIKKYLN